MQNTDTFNFAYSPAAWPFYTVLIINVVISGVLFFLPFSYALKLTIALGILVMLYIEYSLLRRSPIRQVRFYQEQWCVQLSPQHHWIQVQVIDISRVSTNAMVIVLQVVQAKKSTYTLYLSPWSVGQQAFRSICRLYT